jgi:endonuclease/exonuclease/phosphatase family metal-dependent hydrolase
MRKGLFLLAAAFFLVLLPASGALANEQPFPKGESVKVKVMSYNIHHGEGEDGVLDLERIAKVIEESNAEIIGLQEVDNHWSKRSNFKDQAKWLAERLGMFYTYAANLDRDPISEGESRRQYGTAILSEYPILESENHFLTKFDYPDRYSEQRGLLEAAINVKGTHLHFYNTHLGLTTEQRQIQMKEIVEIVAQTKGPKVIMGDLNATPESSEMEPMFAHYKDAFANQNEAYTYSAESPSKRIDYIFTSANIKTEDARVIQTLASDHLPLTADIVLERSTPYENGNNK